MFPVSTPRGYRPHPASSGFLKGSTRDDVRKPAGTARMVGRVKRPSDVGGRMVGGDEEPGRVKEGLG